jgi:hypothetical protein
MSKLIHITENGTPILKGLVGASEQLRSSDDQYKVKIDPTTGLMTLNGINSTVMSGMLRYRTVVPAPNDGSRRYVPLWSANASTGSGVTNEVSFDFDGGCDAIPSSFFKGSFLARLRNSGGTISFIVRLHYHSDTIPASGNILKFGYAPNTLTPGTRVTIYVSSPNGWMRIRYLSPTLTVEGGIAGETTAPEGYTEIAPI